METIRKSGDHSLTIINDILDHSKIEAGHVGLNHAPFDLRVLVEESMEFVAARADRKQTVAVTRADDNFDDSRIIERDVQDTGIGMTTEESQRLFQAFAQADASISRKYGGTGLGLAISKKLTEAMGGTIQVQSEPARG